MLPPRYEPNIDGRMPIGMRRSIGLPERGMPKTRKPGRIGGPAF